MIYTPAIQIAAFGESTFKGVNSQNPQPNNFCVPDMVARTFGVGLNQPILKVNNRAISGGAYAAQRQVTTQDKVTLQFVPGALQDSQIAKTNGSLAIINMGINDAWNGVPVADFITSTRNFVKTCKALGKTVIIQSPSKIVSSASYSDGILVKDSVTPAQRLGLYSSSLKSLSYEMGVYFVDSNSRNDITTLSDPFHPTNSGYNILKEDILKVVNSSFINKLNAQLQVSLMYTSILGRVPEKSGMDWWVARLLNTVVSFSNSSLTQAFLDTPEAQTRFPTSLSNKDFIKSVYSKILGRPSSVSDEVYWEAQLSYSSKAVVLTNIIGTTATYSVQGGSDFSALASESLMLNRAHTGLSYSVVFGKPAIDSPLPYGKLANVTSDPLSVLNVGVKI